MARLLLFLLPQTLSLLGSSLAQYGIIWMLTLRYASGKVLLAATLASFIPQILLMLLSGSVSDKKHRKLVIILSDGLSAITALILAFSYSDTLFLMIALALRSAFSGLQTPAVDSAVPFFVEDSKLEKANGLKALLSSIVTLLSPIATGVLLPAAGLTALLLLDAASALFAILLLLPLQVPEYSEEKNDEKREMFSLLKEKRMRNIFLFHGISLFLVAPGATLTPLLVAQAFSSSASSLSFSEAAYSLGMVIGGLLIALRGSRNSVVDIIISLVFYAMMMILISISPYFILYLCCNMVIGMISPRYTAAMASEVQRRTDGSRMGRSMALFSAIGTSAVPLGMMLFAPLADSVGVENVFAAAGLALLCFILICRKLLENKS